jgi:hypothetical protein
LHTGGTLGAEEDALVYKGRSNGSIAGYIMRSFTICTATPNVSGDQRMRWFGNVARTGAMRHACRVLIGKLERTTCKTIKIYENGY